MNREISDLLFRACHDIRSPLRAIRAHSELLLRDSLSQPGASNERLGFIVDGVKKIEGLLDGLTRYSTALQISNDSFQPTSLDVALRAALSKMKKEMQESGAEVTYDSLPRVMANADRMIELLETLVRNAIVHRGDAAPRIHISAALQDENWKLAVRDNGPGVDAEYLEKIFEPFQRLHGNERPGAGLGLAISRAIVENHGGRIWAESEAGKGSTFYISLPAG